MSPSRSPKRLGDLVARARDLVELAADETYKEITVRLWGKGAVLRREVLGGDIGAKKRNVAHTGQLVFSRIDARNGAFALVPEELDGAVLSNDFPTYDINAETVLPEYLFWLTQSTAFIEACGKASEGTTNRVRIKEDQLLDQLVEIPDVAAQQAAVSLIERALPLCRKVEECRASAVTRVDGVMQAELGRRFSSLAEDATCTELGTLLTRNRLIRSLEPGVSYSGLGTRMWGRGVYVHEVKDGSAFEAERYEVCPDQLIYNEVWAHNGALGVVGSFGPNMVVSRHFHVFDVDWSTLDKVFLQRLFQSPWFWAQCQEGSVSTTGRGHLRRPHFNAIRIPTPSLEEQRRHVAELDALEENVHALQRIQSLSTPHIQRLMTAVVDALVDGHE